MVVVRMSVAYRDTAVGVIPIKFVIGNCYVVPSQMDLVQGQLVVGWILGLGL